MANHIKLMKDLELFLEKHKPTSTPYKSIRFSPDRDIILPEDKCVCIWVQNTYAEITAVSMFHATGS